MMGRGRRPHMYHHHQQHQRRLGCACLLVLCQCLAGTFAISALRLPVSLTAIEGGRAEFNCSAEGMAPGQELYWAVNWERVTLMWYFLPAEVNGSHSEYLRGPILKSVRADSLSGHGRYSTQYREVPLPDGGGGTASVALLRVDGVRDGDRGRYHCVYREAGTFRNLEAPGQSGQALLAVVAPPEGDAPSCQASPVASSDPTLGGALVQLSCISPLIAADPLPTIAWFTGGQELSSATGNANLYRYTLKERDNGRAFVCQVAHPSLATPRTCSVVPLNEPPNAVLTPETLVSAPGLDATFRCIGSGIPYISKYTWYVGESSVGQQSGADGAAITPKISFAGSDGWRLSLPDLAASANNTRVTCEVSLPSGLSSNATATLVLRDGLPIAVVLAPKRARVFGDAGVAFSCLAETEAKVSAFKWYIGSWLVSPANETVARGGSLDIRSLGASGSMLRISRSHAARFETDAPVTCEAVTSTGESASDSGLLVARANYKLEVEVVPKVVKAPASDPAAAAKLTCLIKPDAPRNATVLWSVRCEAGRTSPGSSSSSSGKDSWTVSDSTTISLDNLKRWEQCDVTCTVSTPAGSTASATGLVLVVESEQIPASVGEVQQPETRSTDWRLQGTLGAGGVGTFLGIFICSLLLLLYACSKSYHRSGKKTGPSAPRGDAGTPIYETINPQCGSRDPIAPELPLLRVNTCNNQQQSNATYNRPPMTIPTLRVTMPSPRDRLQRIPSTDEEEDDEEGSMVSTISKDSLNTELAMSSSPSTVTFGGYSDDSEEHEYESCEITTCV